MCHVRARLKTILIRGAKTKPEHTKDSYKRI